MASQTAGDPLCDGRHADIDSNAADLIALARFSPSNQVQEGRETTSVATSQRLASRPQQRPATDRPDCGWQWLRHTAPGRTVG